jgi:hypothetical protein
MDETAKDCLYEITEIRYSREGKRVPGLTETRSRGIDLIEIQV